MVQITGSDRRGATSAWDGTDIVLVTGRNRRGAASGRDRNCASSGKDKRDAPSGRDIVQCASNGKEQTWCR